jgi:hypothetical protein
MAGIDGRPCMEQDLEGAASQSASEELATRSVR